MHIYKIQRIYYKHITTELQLNLMNKIQEIKNRETNEIEENKNNYVKLF